MGNDSKPQSASAASKHTVDFTTIVLSFREVALLAMGMMENPDESYQLPKDLEAARTQIDMLEILADKTQNNLTDDEKRLLDSVLYELRVAFVEAKKG